jgi:transposase
VRGEDERSGALSSYVDFDARGWAGSSAADNPHDRDDALAALAGFSRMGRPSISPAKLLRAMLLQAFYSIRSERQLMERLEFDLLFRWFVAIGVDDAAWDH